MTCRLTLVTPGLTPGARAGVVGVDEPLDEHGRRAVVRLAGTLPDAAVTILTAPERQCVETAALIAGTSSVETLLRDWDLGTWTGQSLADLATDGAEALRQWRTAGAAPHGGETLDELRRRVGTWLGSLPPHGSSMVVVAPAAVVRACVVHVLDCPSESFWTIDVEPAAAVGVTLSEAGARLRWTSVTSSG